MTFRELWDEIIAPTAVIAASVGIPAALFVGGVVYMAFPYL